MPSKKPTLNDLKQQIATGGAKTTATQRFIRSGRKEELPERRGWKAHGRNYLRSFPFPQDMVTALEAIQADNPGITMNALVRWCVNHTVEEVQSGKLKLPVKQRYDLE